MLTDFILVLITVPSSAVGQKIAGSLLEKHLAACVNILPSIASFYTWEGQAQNEEELLLLVKTRADLFHEQLIPAVEAIHPYKVPEIIALPVVMGSQSYLDWVAAETAPAA